MPLRIVDERGLGFVVEANPNFYDSLYETLVEELEVIVVK